MQDHNSSLLIMVITKDDNTYGVVIIGPGDVILEGCRTSTFNTFYVGDLKFSGARTNSTSTAETKPTTALLDMVVFEVDESRFDEKCSDCSRYGVGVVIQDYGSKPVTKLCENGKIALNDHFNDTHIPLQVPLNIGTTTATTMSHFVRPSPSLFRNGAARSKWIMLVVDCTLDSDSVVFHMNGKVKTFLVR